MLHSGLYEQLINTAIGRELDADTNRLYFVESVDRAEAAKILSRYISEVIEKVFDNLKDHGGNVIDLIELANKMMNALAKEIDEQFLNALSIDKRAQLLVGLFDKKNSMFAFNEKAEMIRPKTSIAYSSLFTGAVHEPSMYTELKKEILSSDRIDILVSFIKWSGLRLIIDALRTFTIRGGKLRLITTSYMGATDPKAIEEISQLPHTKIMVSYDTKRTRLHAKTYVFYRDTGFTTAYVGSSNLSNAAISSGLEWNVKITAKDLPDIITKINATFESYWNSNDFEPYNTDQKQQFEKALKAERFRGKADKPYLFDIHPYPYQQEILDKLRAEREVRGYYNNLIVAATGTGKTVISAFDYRSFCRVNPVKPNRLLFVAHREEILKQSLACFQGVLKDTNFGDLFVGKYRPDSIDHLFISIQTFHSQALYAKTSPDFYDYIIVDEFHHAAAPSYRKLLSYYKPKVLLGLTATPERMDGKNIFKYFNNRIAAEIRLPEAIERKLLCPFQYFGITDTVDLSTIKWIRGGYDRSELTNLYSLNRAVAKRRVHHIIQSLDKYITDMDEVKGLGFCVSVEHAKFMAEHFNASGIPSLSLISQSTNEERNTAKQKLISGELRFLFVVDIYNEGVDIPEVNTVLFLRPTESLTIFLQQLGRGLRLAEGKECLTVLDFIGQANKQYNFEDKFAALLTNTTHRVQHEIKDGFVHLPKGCYIQLERKAKEYILKNIRRSFGAKAGIISHIATFVEDTGKPLNLNNFIEYYHLDPRTIYSRDCFARLCVFAGVRDDYNEDIEPVFKNAFPRICTIDSRRWIDCLLDLLPRLKEMNLSVLNGIERTFLQMFYVTVWNQSAEDLKNKQVLKNLHTLANSPVILNELLELLHYNRNQIDLVDAPVDVDFDFALDLHCTYSMRQIATAMGYFNYSALQGIGVKYFPEKKTDVFFITLNKSEKDYSPTTMYNDYSINEWMFHWQSQSTTADTSPTGQRYIHHKATDNKILLFVREHKKDNFGTCSYTFLGLADYVKHTGSKPMNITWKLLRPIPAKYLKKTNQLVG